MKKSNPSTSTSRRVGGRTAESGISAYFTERKAAYLAALGQARSYCAVEGVHELRVETKKLRALYRLMGKLAPTFSVKTAASPLKPVFRSAGALRDIDIYQALTLPYLKELDLREYFNFLKHEELSLRREFALTAQKIGAPAFLPVEKVLYSSIGTIESERLHKRSDKRVRKLAERLIRLIESDGQADADHLHAIRKTAKTLRYTLDVWQRCFGRRTAVQSVIRGLKAAYGLLGEWRDASLTIRSMDAFLKRHLERGQCAKTAYSSFRRALTRTAGARLGQYRKERRELVIKLRLLIALVSKPGA